MKLEVGFGATFGDDFVVQTEGDDASALAWHDQMVAAAEARSRAIVDLTNDYRAQLVPFLRRLAEKGDDHDMRVNLMDRALWPAVPSVSNALLNLGLVRREHGGSGSLIATDIGRASLRAFDEQRSTPS